ncbi:hypothetical protein GCM10023149_49430 [Mucilaginibacter gynuensis]|uniref:Uncharacterized protein n=1 Tax=Mucilaginibacter gynuensis TaxID=1302236 RepID=A0ABP8HHH1_9SPHI
MNKPEKQEIELLNGLMIMRSEIGYQRTLEIKNVTHSQLNVGDGGGDVPDGII